jgi:hypothetical protein
LQTNSLLLGKISFVVLLCIVGVAIIVANYFGKENATMMSNFLNLAITIPLLVVSILLLVKHGTGGDLGKACTSFVLFVVLWFIAERIWMIDELVYHLNPWPSEADYFWLAGYPPYFAFTIFYLRPFKNSISAKLVIFALCTTAAIAGFLVYYTSLQGSELSIFETVLGLSYPIFDTISLAPVIIGLVLFFRGEVNFMWACLFFGMLCLVIADYGFLFLSLDTTYYTGHPVDIPYLWAYLFFLSGVYSHLRIFKKRGNNERFDNQRDLR